MLGFTKNVFFENEQYRHELYESYLAERKDKNNFIKFLDTIIDDCNRHKQEYININRKLSGTKTQIIRDESKKIEERSQGLIHMRVMEEVQKRTQELQKEAFEAREKYYEKVIEVSNLNQKVKKQEKLIDKWKAMFTEQALANAKLINNGGTKCQKNTMDGN